MWVWPGSQAPTPPPTASAVPLGFRCHAEIEVEVPVEHGLLLENLLDLAHAPFTHTSTFAKGWPVRRRGPGEPLCLLGWGVGGE